MRSNGTTPRMPLLYNRNLAAESGAAGRVVGRLYNTPTLRIHQLRHILVPSETLRTPLGAEWSD